MAPRQGAKGGVFPPFPNVTDPQEIPPEKTDPVVRTMPGRLKLYADADNANYQDYVDENPTRSGNNPKLCDYWTGSNMPPQYTIQCLSYWEIIPETTHVLQPGDSWSRTYSVTQGISTTDSTTVTAELGAEGEGLSAKLSVAFEHSVTVSHETTVTTTLNSGPVPEDKMEIIAMYQLMDEIRVVDGNDDLINYAARGDVDFTDDRHYSGAYLSIKDANQKFPSGMTYILQKRFDIK